MHISACLGYMKTYESQAALGGSNERSALELAY